LHALSLYDGRLGVLVALAEVDELDGGDRAGSLFSLSMEAVDRLVVVLEREAASGRGLLPVGLSGLGGLLWALVRLADDGRRPAALAVALALARRIDARWLADDSALDLESGAAGAVLGLLAVAEAARAAGGDEDAAAWALKLARAGGARLLEAQGADGGWAPGSGSGPGPALAGFAHGAAGISRALDALAAGVGDCRYRDAARRGIAFERALFDPERGNWPVLQADPRLGELRRTWMVAWCHGAPGIALGRALAAGLADERTRSELERAAATTAAAPAASDDHLCCGAAGRVAVLDALGRRSGRPDARAAAAAGARALAAGTAAGPRLPAGSAAARRSLFRGTAGVAWALARVAGPARALDALALELPHEAGARAAAGER
jgi:lantibiotic modifying enzyme